MTLKISQNEIRNMVIEGIQKKGFVINTNTLVFNIADTGNVSRPELVFEGAQVELTEPTSSVSNIGESPKWQTTK